MRLHARHIAASTLLLALLDLPASAQGLNLGVNLGGTKVGVNVGGGNTGVSVGTGSSSSSSNSTINDLFGLDIQADLFGLADGSGNNSNTLEVLSQDQALEAVLNRKAMPLDKVMLMAQLSTTGQIIDASLVNVKGFLLYVFKVLETDGDVSELYFYARSGQMVESR